MFEAHAIPIRNAALTSPDITARVIIFAILTANAPLHLAVNATRWVREHLPLTTYDSLTTADKAIMGAAMSTQKYNAVKYVWENRVAIYNEFLNRDAIDFWNYCIDSVPGLGMVKSAFTVQMLYNELGCVDVHNVRELGLPPFTSNYSKRNRNLYLSVQSVKTSASWWTDWCDFMAKKYSKRYDSGWQVSESHVAAIL